MLAVSHTSLVVCALMVTSCNRITEAKLFGTWRAEDDETVNEIACRRDYTFTSWTDAKNVLTTPSCLISSGKWRLQHQQLLVHFTKHVAVDSWEDEDTNTSITVLKVAGDTLLMKNFDGSKVLSYHRLLPDYVLTPMKRALNDADLIGTWRIHYHTRDYEMSLDEDHTCADFAQLKGVRTQFFAGTWRIKNNDLIMDTKSIPAFDGESITNGHQRWSVISVEPRRIAIRDGPVQYLMQRLK